MSHYDHMADGLKSKNAQPENLLFANLLDEKAVAEILNVKVSTLRRWRWAGKGPRFLKIGAAVRYAPHSLRTFLAAAERSSTSESSSEYGQ